MNLYSLIKAYVTKCNGKDSINVYITKGTQTNFLVWDASKIAFKVQEKTGSIARIKNGSSYKLSTWRFSKVMSESASLNLDIGSSSKISLDLNDNVSSKQPRCSRV